MLLEVDDIVVLGRQCSVGRVTEHIIDDNEIPSQIVRNVYLR